MAKRYIVYDEWIVPVHCFEERPYSIKKPHQVYIATVFARDKKHAMSLATDEVRNNISKALKIKVRFADVKLKI